MKNKGLVSFLSAVVVLIAGLLIGFVILLVTDSTNAVAAFIRMLTHGFSSMRWVGTVLLGATPIIFTGLSVAFAFRTGLFNIGASGQFTLGAFTAVFITIHFTFLPPTIRVIVAVLAAMLVGALWGAIPGLLKAFRNVHEVITCIMTNYIAMFLATYLVYAYTFRRDAGRSYPPPLDARIPTLGLENVFTDGRRPSSVDIGIFLAIIAAILIYVILQKTTFGYELKACGFNSNAAKYAGINHKRNIVKSMMICGALSGFGGALAYIGGSGRTLDIMHYLIPDGFVGISVAFLGMNHPIGIIFSGTLISFLTIGGNEMQAFGFTKEIVDIVIAIIIYFCAFVLLMNSLLGNFIGRLFGAKETPETQSIESDENEKNILDVSEEKAEGGKQ